MSEPTERFLGLTKGQFLMALLVVLAALAVVLTWLVIHVVQDATQGAQSHDALCVLKNDYSTRLHSSQQFLKLTPDQRVAKYGPIGHTPTATIQQSIKALQSNLHSLRSLDCH